MSLASKKKHLIYSFVNYKIAIFPKTASLRLTGFFMLVYLETKGFDVSQLSNSINKQASEQEH